MAGELSRWIKDLHQRSMDDTRVMQGRLLNRLQDSDSISSKPKRARVAIVRSLAVSQMVTMIKIAAMVRSWHWGNWG